MTLPLLSGRRAGTGAGQYGPWTLVLADRSGTELGEIRRARSRIITPDPLRATPTAAIVLRHDDPFVPVCAQGEKIRLKAYQRQDNGSEALRFNGPVAGFQKVRDGSTGSVAITFAGGAILASDRYVGKTADGFNQGDALNLVDVGEIMARALDEANADDPTQIIRGLITPGAKTYVEKWTFKNLLEAWVELAQPLDGPDWRVAPIEPAQNGGAIGALTIAPALGRARNDAVWEFGTGKANVARWTQIIDPTTVRNRAWSIPPNWPDDTSLAPLSYENAASRADRGLHEAVISGADLTVDVLRQKLLAMQVEVGHFPRQTITFEPRMEVAGDLRYKVDYEEGDAVWFHARERFPLYDESGASVVGNYEVDTVDAEFRLHAVQFSINDNGDATPAFTLVEEG